MPVPASKRKGKFMVKSVNQLQAILIVRKASVNPSPLKTSRPRKSARLSQSKSVFATDNFKWLDDDSDTKSAIDSDGEFSGDSDDENNGDVLDFDPQDIIDVLDDKDSAILDALSLGEASIKPNHVGDFRGELPAHERIVIAAPYEHASRVLRRRFGNLLRVKDRPSVGTSATRRYENKTSIVEALLQSLSRHPDGMLSRRCDYTGKYLYWTIGPRSYSIEAAYLFVQSEAGDIEYHAPPNVCLISTMLNRIKEAHCPVRLPLISEWIRVHDDPDFTSRRARWTWLYNALTNEAIMSVMFKPSTGKGNFDIWRSWSPDKRKAVLQALRTGQKSPFLRSALLGWEHDKKLARPFTPAQLRDPDGLAWNAIYETLRRIAKSRGLTVEEFDYYFSITSPDRQHRVFYPFHILSRPQAQAFGWDWYSLRYYVKHLLYVMRSAYNRHAEVLDLGEKHVDITRTIYWIAAFFCDKVHKVKQERQTVNPYVTREEIAFHILDRWGLPYVPWIRHAFKASFCKGPAHGIAMFFGIKDTGSHFDPVKHIDLSKSTIAIDTWTTNTGMFWYKPSAWDNMRSHLSEVPLQHPFWNVDMSMGSEIWLGTAAWIGHWDTTITPLAPTPGFAVNLVPIEAWVPRADAPAPSLLPYRCQCDAEFPNAGELVHHCRQVHSSNHSDDDHMDPVQDAKDTEYWSNWKVFICDFPSYNIKFKSQLTIDIYKQVY